MDTRRRLVMNSIVQNVLMDLGSKNLTAYSEEWKRGINEHVDIILRAYDILVLSCESDIPFAIVDEISGEITYPHNEAMDNDLVGFLPINSIDFLTFELILTSLFCGVERSDLCELFGAILEGTAAYEDTHLIYAALRQREFILRKKIKK